MKLKKIPGSKHYLQSILETILLFIIISVCFFKFELLNNEPDVIPYAKAVFNSNWLKYDWYLNLKIPYRNLFSYPVGYFSETYGMLKTIVVGRLITYLLVAFSLYRFIKTIKTSPNIFAYFFFMIVFFMVFPKGGSREWMVGGLETKAFAYSFAILSLSSFLNKKTRAGLLFAGLTLSFHLLVGIYNLFCLIPIVWLLQKENRTFVVDTFKSLPVFLLAAGYGIYGIVYQFFLAPKEISNLGWDIYVNIRVKHHTLPNHFWPETWVVMVVFTALNLMFYLKSKNQKTKLISAYALFSVLISFVGLIIFFTPIPNHYLKYYFFRFSDIMLPLITLLNIANFTVERLNKSFPEKEILLKYIFIGVSVILLSTRIFILFSEGKGSIEQMAAIISTDKDMEKWVRNNTRREKIFIVPPDDGSFYMNYDRAMFVSWKHSPQNANDMVEWYNRLKLLNQGEDFQNLSQIVRGYNNLSEKDVISIAKAYPNIGYFLTPSNRNLMFPVLYRSDKNILYDLHDWANIKLD
jgi:hypothetical protein